MILYGEILQGGEMILRGYTGEGEKHLLCFLFIFYY